MAGGQTDFLNDWESTLVGLEGGWASGKTWAGARKLLAGHIYNAIDATGAKTGVPSAVVGPTYRAMMDFDRPQVEEACREFGVKFKWSEKEQCLLLPDFAPIDGVSEIKFRSAENPALITGWEVGVAWGDEPTRWKEDWLDPKKDPFIQLTGRVRHPRRRLEQLILTYTNEGDGTRVYNEFRRGTPRTRLYRAKTKDNLSVKGFYETQMGRLTPEMAEQYLEGGAMSLRGAKCYPNFQPALHVSPRTLPLLKGRPLALMFDFNINPGMHCYVGHYLPEHDRFLVCREIHRDRMSCRDVAPALARVLVDAGGWQFPEAELHGDSSGNADSITTSESAWDVIREGLEMLRIPYRDYVPSSNPTEANRVNAFCMALQDMRGTTHITIDPSCGKLITDLGQVKFDDKGKIDKKNPLLTHPTDAVGYMIHARRPVRVESAVATDLGRFGVRVNR